MQSKSTAPLEPSEHNAVDHAAVNGGPPARWPAALVLLIAFAALAVWVRDRPRGLPGDGLDAHLVSHPGTGVWHFASIITDMGSGPVVGAVAVLVGVVLALRHRWVDGAVVVVATAAAGIAEVAVKGLVGRDRPLTAALSGESGQGFPSGHVCGVAAFVTALVLVLVVGRWSSRERDLAIVVGVALVALVAWSRIVVGAHYLTDTVGAMLLGTAVAFGTAEVAGRVEAARRAR